MSEKASKKFQDTWDSFLERLDAFAIVGMEDKFSLSNGSQTMVVSNKVVRDLVKFARLGIEHLEPKP